MDEADEIRFSMASALRVFTLVLAVYLFTGSSDLTHNGDTTLRYQTTQAMVDHARLWIEHPVTSGTRLAVGLGGHEYVSAYAPGQITFMIPFYLLGKGLSRAFSLDPAITTEYASRSLDLVLGAFLAALLFLMATSLGYSRRVALVLTLIFAFATPAWPDSQSALEHTQVSLFLLLSVFAVWWFVRGGMRERRLLLLAGTASGLTVFTRYDAAIYIPIIVVFLLWMRRSSVQDRPLQGIAGLARALRGVRRRHGYRGELSEIARDLLTYGLAMVPWALLLLLWNQLRFGSPFNVALHLKTFGEPPWIGLPGLLVSPGKGIIWYLPLVFLLPWAAPRFYRRLPGPALLFAALVTLTLFFYANVLYWHGDPAWGPRYLYPMLPYLILPLGEIISAWRRGSVQRALLPGGHDPVGEGLVPSRPRSGRAPCTRRHLWPWRSTSGGPEGTPCGAGGHKTLPYTAMAAIGLLTLSLALQVAAISVTQWRFWYHLQAMKEHTAQPFNWGPTAYTYYWNLRENPILFQFRDVYEVIDLDAFGNRSQRLTARPTVCAPGRCLSNPAADYPVNTLAFWWADVRHPLVPAGVRAALALLLVAVACSMALLLARDVRAP
jgi:hypothetical protein